MRIYNLFPLLAGRVGQWSPHLERAARLGFDWVFVNPIQKLGGSGSLYSIQDYFSINPSLVKAGRTRPETQVRSMIGKAHELGLQMMVDLVINHCAYDAPLLKEHPGWFVHEGGRIAHPYCEDEGERVVWRDLARFDHRNGQDREGLYRHCLRAVNYLCELGFRGFRCDAAYQVPADFWQRLIAEVRQTYPDVLFVAETLGCTPEMTRETASAGFDAIFNSSKWWDFDSDWLMDQYRMTREKVPSISFPESHDTPRLMEEADGNEAVLRQRYLFAALFSGGVMMPMGFEYGFRRALNVVNTRPEDWEETTTDLGEFIRHINSVKSRYPVFQEDAPTERVESSNPSVLLLRKEGFKRRGEALLVINKDPWNRQSFHCDDLYRHVRGGGPLVDVSAEWAMEYLPTPYDFELSPGMGRILVTE